MIHVLTLTWNGLHHLKELQGGLFDNLKKTGQEYKWYIRSNGCTDGTQEECLNWENTEVLLKNHNRDSFSAGVNSLYDLTKPNKNDLILLLNNDIVFRDKVSLKKMVQLMDKTGAAMCGARMMYPNSDKISHVGTIFSKNYGGLAWNLDLEKQLKPEHKKDKYFQAVTAACCFVKAKNFESAGKLDTNYFFMYEDVHLCLEISINQKEKIVCCGGTEIDHETSASLKKNNYNKLFLNKNVQYFKSKWYGKYKLDHELYLNNPSYGEIKV